jgi:hypothetical protein
VPLKSNTHSFGTDILLDDFLVAENAPFQSENPNRSRSSSGSPSNRQEIALSFFNLPLSVLLEFL